MRVAISTDGEVVSEHFGRCPTFTMLDIEGGKAVDRKEINNPGHAPGIIPQFLHEKGVKLIVCGGMGARASGLFEEFGIEAITGVSGKINEAISRLENGILEGGESLCKPGEGRGYGVEKTVCDHPHEDLE
jgi:predicted Fe-Mo cluster-binding NifX family protein